MSQYKFYTFDEWIKLHPEFDIDETCISCGGSGEDENDSNFVCPYCDRECTISYAEEEYERQRQLDEERIKRLNVSTD